MTWPNDIWAAAVIKLDLDMTLDELNALRASTEARGHECEHFYLCPACGQAVDCRRLGDVLHHDQPRHSRLPTH